MHKRQLDFRWFCAQCKWTDMFWVCVSVCARVCVCYKCINVSLTLDGFVLDASEPICSECVCVRVSVCVCVCLSVCECACVCVSVCECECACVCVINA